MPKHLGNSEPILIVVMRQSWISPWLVKYICSWSGGKDSTASVILAHEHNEPLDIIVFAEIMFDQDKGISGENVGHIDFVYKNAKPLFESWGYEVKILRSDSDYLSVFHKIIQRPTKHMEHKGMKYGFPISGRCSIKRDCKLRPINRYFKSLSQDYCQYIGICTDEPKRLDSMKKDKTKNSLLEKYGYTQKMAQELCEKYLLLSPSYNLTKRNGCWFCPNAKLGEHRELRAADSETWYRFISLEHECNLAQDKWNAITKETLHSRELILGCNYTRDVKK